MDQLLIDYGVDPNHVAEARDKIVAATIAAHIPSLSNANDEELTQRVAWFSSPIALNDTGYIDIADLALRTCACGASIDGYYQYVDHLIAVFGGESHYGG